MIPSLNLESLAALEIFSEISPASLQCLHALCRCERAEAGDLIFSEGQQGDGLYVVLEGAVKITRYIEGIGEEQLSICREGSYFGELSLIDDAPRAADARAIASTLLLRLRKADLEETMFADPAFAREMLWVLVRRLATRLRETNEKLRALVQMEIL